MRTPIEIEDDLEQLLEAVRAMSKARSIDNVMQVVKVVARKLVAADGVTFVLRDEDKCYYADENAIAPLWKGKRFPAETCISGWSMIHRQDVVIPDIYSDERIPVDAYRPTFVKSLAMVPVRREDPIAAIGAYWASRHEANSRELWLLQTLADSTALALANVELILGLTKKAEEYSSLYEQARDEIRKRERLEEELRQAQKMEAIGRLAGGVAHDFNNLLMVISGYCEILLTGEAEPHEIRDLIREVHDAGNRASALTRQLLAFSRKQVLQPKLLDLNDVVGQMSKMLKRLIGEDIDLVVKLNQNLYPVKVDPGQMEQIVMNLAANARDAMPRGGKLTIETANAQLDDLYVSDHPEARTGPHAVIALTDTGEGMTPETKARIFEPFYTTKEVGKGTGLGLSTVYGIVKQSGGNIWVYSELGQGTTFKVYLPLAEGVEVAEPETGTRQAHSKGCATILVVEDDAAVRGLIKKVLIKGGYEVIDAGDPESATEICRRHNGPIHLLLTDMVMPKTNGRELASQALAIRPELKVAFMSGYTENAVLHHGALEPGAAFIEKPISPATLLSVIREHV